MKIKFTRSNGSEVTADVTAKAKELKTLLPGTSRKDQDVLGKLSREQVNRLRGLVIAFEAATRADEMAGTEPEEIARYIRDDFKLRKEALLKCIRQFAQHPEEA